MNCTAALLTIEGGALAGYERKGKVQKRSLDHKYTMQVGFTGDNIIWTRQKIDISNTLLVSIADTTGGGVAIVRASSYSCREIYPLTVGAGVP